MGVHVGVRELRDHLSSWLERVKDGEEVIVTERGRPIARLASVELPSKLQRLIDAGVVSPPKRPKGKALPRVPVTGGVSDLVERWR